MEGELLETNFSGVFFLELDFFDGFQHLQIEGVNHYQQKLRIVVLILRKEVVYGG